MRTLSELIWVGKQVLEYNSPTSAHDEFGQWDEMVSDWLEEAFPNSPLAAQWNALPGSRLIIGYHDDPQSWSRFHDTVETRLQWLASSVPSSPAITTTRTNETEPERIHSVFLSHASADQHIAKYVQERLTDGKHGLKVFLSSVPGHIPAGSDWLARVKGEIDDADAYLILLTPASITRPWVIFETGAAWMSKRALLPVRAGGLAASDLPMPLGTFQTLSFEDPREAFHVFTQLGSRLGDPEGFAARVRELGRTSNATGAVDAEWEGILINDRYFAWAGPYLYSVQDRRSTPEPPELIHALRERGFVPSFGNRARLKNYLAKGRRQVFETDRSSWRREVVNSVDQVLLIRDAPSK
jgi:TIR domain